MGELKIVKITNPFYLGKTGPFVAEFLKKVPVAGVTYETLYTHFANTVQHGQIALQQGVRDKAEFWVVLDEGKPIAFAHWFVKGVPYIGTVMCDFVYSWQRKKEPAGMLFDEFKRFGLDHRAQIWESCATNNSVFQVLKNAALERGMDVHETNWNHFVMVRNENLPEDKN
jgi:hypothetical protein